MGFEEIFGFTMILFLAVYGFIIMAFTASLFHISKSANKQISTSIHHPINISFNNHIPQSSNFQIIIVSVIIAVRNEASNILRLLEEMRTQDFRDVQMEVIISDDYSDDHTMEFAGRFARQFPGFPLVLISSSLAPQGAYGKKKAIERAVKLARGEVLLFTDADTFHGSSWITSMVKYFKNESQHMVLGPVVFCNEKNLLQKIQTLEFLGLMATTAGSAGLGYPVMCNGANLAYRRQAFYETGGFSGNQQYRSGDDQFMMSSIKKHYGKRAIYFNFDPLAIVSTIPESTLTGFFQQRIRWVSKSRGYSDRAVLITGLVTYLLHVLLLIGFFLGFWNPRIFVISLVLWLLKILLEYPMVMIMMRFSTKQELRGYYFVAQVFQLIYLPVVGILGLILPYRWKGRSGGH
jgi:cellulose synthase/poly-beta-1,6-N-acetylglucosamine synthase-like glycosyltransferase